MTFHCPVTGCVNTVPREELCMCKPHYKLVPRPQQDALNHYARSHKGGPAHRGSFKRAVETVNAFIGARAPQQASTPYRDD